MWDWASIPHNSWKTNKESIKKRIKIYWRLLQTNADCSNRITIAAKFWQPARLTPTAMTDRCV